jgi:hypothetical protein
MPTTDPNTNQPTIKSTLVKLSLHHEVNKLTTTPTTPTTPTSLVSVEPHQHRIVCKLGRATKAAGPWCHITDLAQLRVRIGTQLRHFVAVFEPSTSTTAEVMELVPVDAESLVVGIKAE